MSVQIFNRPFLWRRLHSLMGLWLLLFLCEHLLTNSQAALWIGKDGKGFIDLVNKIHDLPYLKVVEILLLGVPLLIHMVWGIRYALTAKFNRSRSDGSTPQIKTGRNRAYSWQRITSWILLICLIFHIITFRFLKYPQIFTSGGTTSYLVPLSVDAGLYTVANRLHVTLYDKQSVESAAKTTEKSDQENVRFDTASMLSSQDYDLVHGPIPQPYSSQNALILTAAQQDQTARDFVKTLEGYHLNSSHVIGVTSDFGTATLLSVRDTFKSPLYIAGYTVFVLAACFHACQGLWSFLITWGLVLKASWQRTWIGISTLLMLLLIFFGLAAIWGSYWINLKY